MKETLGTPFAGRKMLQENIALLQDIEDIIFSPLKSLCNQINKHSTTKIASMSHKNYQDHQTRALPLQLVVYSP